MLNSTIITEKVCLDGIKIVLLHQKWEILQKFHWYDRR